MQHSNSRVFAVVGIVVAAIHYGVLASSIVAVVVAVITCVVLALVLFGSPALCVLILGRLALFVVPGRSEDVSSHREAQLQ